MENNFVMRTSGILMHISSLPSPYGIGTFGKEAKRFCEFLKKAGQTYWQILPIGMTSFGDSPYQSFSSFAGNPYFIDPELLEEDGYLLASEYKNVDFGKNYDSVDYGKLYGERYKMLRLAYARFDKKAAAYTEFCEKNVDWLDDFALFMAIKNANGGKAWYTWDDELKMRDKAALAKAREALAEDFEFYRVIEYFFFTQWEKVKAYANSLKIKIIGDIPIYVAYDSADVWSAPENFDLDEELAPKNVAGCPPDAFTADGQLWGNPLYDWAYMKKDGYSWWVNRVKASLAIFDVIRLDHFRGFEAYWSVPAKDKTARNGKWVKGPGYDLFETLEKKLGKIPFIAEDLGFMTEGVRALLEKTGYPGMNVIEFAFDPHGDSDYMPHNIKKNSVAYIGTHDNSPVMEWLASTSEAVREFAEGYMCLNDAEGKNWGVIRTLLACPADTAIIQMQDILSLSKGARMNTPGESGENWKWRIRSECINEWLANIIRKKTSLYRRIPGENGNS